MVSAGIFISGPTEKFQLKDEDYLTLWKFGRKKIFSVSMPRMKSLEEEREVVSKMAPKQRNKLIEDGVEFNPTKVYFMIYYKEANHAELFYM